MKLAKKLFAAIVIAGISSAAFAQNVPLVERVIEVETKEKNPATARSLLMNQAAEKVSEDLIKEIIGEAKFARNRAMIQSKVMKKSASYLPFSKAGDLRQVGDSFQMAVTVRASVDDLQKLLLENGLFYDADSTPSVLPLVKWVDRVRGRSFGWWMGAQAGADATKAFLVKESRSLETALHDAFLRSGFYVIRPQALRYEDLLGGDSRGENLRPDEASAWAQNWNAQVLIQGQLQFAKGERSDTVGIEARLTAVQVSNGRVIGEVARALETDSGAFEANVDRKLKDVLAPMASDLSAQLLEAWKQGTINSQLYRLKVAGRLTIPVQEQLKEVLRGKVREIKSVKERMIEADAITYELDSSINPAEIAKRLGELDVQGVRLVVDQANEKDLVLKLKR